MHERRGLANGAPPDGANDLRFLCVRVCRKCSARSLAGSNFSLALTAARLVFAGCCGITYFSSGGDHCFFQVIGWSHLRIVTLLGGGSVYLLIYGLAIVAILRLRGRKEIFLFGRLKFEALAMYLIWLIFALAFVPRMVSGWPVYSLLGFAALAALVVRIACLVRHRRAMAAAG